MQHSEDFSVKCVQEESGGAADQVDGSSLSRRKGVRVSGQPPRPADWDRAQPSIVHSYVGSPGPPGPPTVVPISPPPHRPPGAPGRGHARAEDSPPREEWTREVSSHTGVSKQTMDELKSILRESSLLGTRAKEEGRPSSHYTSLHGSRTDTSPHGSRTDTSLHGSRTDTSLHGSRTDGRQDEASQHRSFTTFKPSSDSSRRAGGAGGSGEGSSHQLGSSLDSSSSHRSDGAAKSPPGVWSPVNESSVNWGESGTSQTDIGKERSDAMGNQNFVSAVEQGKQQNQNFVSAVEPVKQQNQNFVSAMERVKQQISRENINFVRFEATDLHGVSRSKTVPVRFFQEKAIFGVPMPRSYLELTLCSKSSEVDNTSAAIFSSDVLLVPDLCTFRVLPWAEQTSRVICDPCTVTGVPLRTSPRLIARQLLGQLQSLGFSLHASFTYECCVLGAPERVGPKTLMFPATTLLSNHDLPFFQQLVDGMYCMGADVDSFAPAIGPGQMEINLRPEFGIAAADSAFTFRTGIKEMARKHSYVASFFTDDGLRNAGVLSHSLWDANGRRSLFQAGGGGERHGELSEIGRKWLAGLLSHAAALSCLMSPGVGCRSHIAKTAKDPKHETVFATCGCNDNNSSFNIKSHGGRETYVDNKLGSAMANPYVALAATVAAGLDGIKRNLNVEMGLNTALTQQRQSAIPVKLDEALLALEEDGVMCSALGEPFVQYFIAMKRFEIETQELDEERNKCLEYFI